MELLDRRRFDEGRTILRCDDDETDRLALIGRDLGEKLVVGNAGSALVEINSFQATGAELESGSAGGKPYQNK